MPFKRLKARIERLELQSKGGECDGCTQTAMLHLQSGIAARNEHPDCSIDWSAIPRLPCPDCGNRLPKIPMRVLDAIMSNKERVAQAKKEVLARIQKEEQERAAQMVGDQDDQ